LPKIFVRYCIIIRANNTDIAGKATLYNSETQPDDTAVEVNEQDGDADCAIGNKNSRIYIIRLPIIIER
jgi:hypothetical protein